MESLAAAMQMGKGRYEKKPGHVIPEVDVDVKDLLSLEGVIIEKRALDSILRDHSSDLVSTPPAAIYE